jgi:lipoate-protein ligase B
MPLLVRMYCCCSVRKPPGAQFSIKSFALEHLPTYTTGRRDGSQNPDTLHPEEKKVQHVGAEFHITKRGGQVTYHGPGQLVGYPILDLNAMEVCVVSDV